MTMVHQPMKDVDGKNVFGEPHEEGPICKGVGCVPVPFSFTVPSDVGLVIPEKKCEGCDETCGSCQPIERKDQARDNIPEEVRVTSDPASNVFKRMETPEEREVRMTSETGGQKGSKQARIGSLDPQALLLVAMVAGFGEVKYARLNYMKGYAWSLSFDAMIRHLLAFWSGEDLDPESGLPHLAHAAWHCLCLLAFMREFPQYDDRYKHEDMG